MTLLLDRSVLAAATFGNAELEREVLGLFRTQAAKILAQLVEERTGLSQGELLHTLKGSARSIGAMEVADICQDLERAVGAEKHTRFEGLAAAIQRADAAIATVLETQPPN